MATEQEQIDKFNAQWTFGEETSPVYETTPDGKIWLHASAQSGETVVVRSGAGDGSGEFHAATFLTLTSSFGTAKVIFEGKSELTRVHCNQIGFYVTPELTEGQILQSRVDAEKFYNVVRKSISNRRFQMQLQPCDATGLPIDLAPFSYFTLSELKFIQRLP